MTKNKLFMILTMGGVAATLSCDDGSAVSSGGLSTNDCPIGMFRPVGLAECVFSAEDVNGVQLALSDDRCAAGTPAIPPTCVSDTGLRTYLASSTTCAPSYRYEPGACERGGNNLGSAGGFTTGFGTAGVGAAGAAGGEEQAGAFGGTGAAGSEEQAGASGGFDTAGAAGTTNLGVAGGND